MDMELEHQKLIDRTQNIIKEIKLRKIDTKKKAVAKGFKMAAVPLKLLNAMRHPWKTYNNLMDKFFNYEDEATDNLEQVKQIQAELEQKEKAETSTEEFTPTLIPEDQNETVITNTDEPVLTPEVNIEEPALITPTVTTDEPVLTPEVKMEEPVLTPEVKEEEALVNSGFEVASDENFKYLTDRKKELEEKIKSLKSNKDYSQIDEIIDLEDMLDEVNKQLDNIDNEIARQIEEEIKKRDVEEAVEVKEEPKNSIFGTMANFLTEIVEDKKVENMEIDEQIAMLMARKEKNNNIISSYEPYIEANLFNAELSTKKEEKEEIAINNEMAEVYGENHLEKARILGQINQIKAELRNTDFNSANELRVQLKKLEGRLDGLSFEQGYSKTK